MSVQQFWNLSQLLGVFTCRELANLCQNFVTETCKQHSETTRRRLCCENLGTSHDVKGFAIGSFLKRIVVERALTSVRKTLKTLVCWAQNRSISSEICPETNHKIRRFFYRLLSGQVCHENSREIPAKSANFFAIFSQKIPRNLSFFSATYQKPCKLFTVVEKFIYQKTIFSQLT